MARSLTSTEILVSPEDDAEVRRVSITNSGNRVRKIELTTYSEVVLTAADADSAHPAFAKLFVQTEFVAAAGTLLATRRTREPAELELWAAHLSVLEGEALGGLQFETDRARFLGRGRDLRNAVSIVDARPLSNTVGTVLDPVLSLRRRVRVAPGETVRVAFWTILAQAGPRQYRSPTSIAIPRRSIASWPRPEPERRRSFGRWASISTTRSNSSASPTACCIAMRRCARRKRYSPAIGSGPSALWSFGVSGDLPIVLVRIDDERRYGGGRAIAARPRVLAPEASIRGSRDTERRDIQRCRGAADRDRAAIGPFVARDRREDGATSRPHLFVAQRIRFRHPPAIYCRRRRVPCSSPSAAACATSSRSCRSPRRCREVGRKRPAQASRGDTPRAVPTLEYFNGLGGFASAGREYVTILEQDQRTPAPWINVVANPHFGFQVSADGAGSTWSLNARENQLTPWSNDPVSDPPSEVIYLRDAASGEVWTRDAAAHPAAGSPLCRASRLRLHPLRTRIARSRSGPDAIRSLGRFGEDFALEDRQPVRRNAAAVGHLLLGLGAGQSAQPDRAVHRHRNRAENRRVAGPQPMAYGVPIAHRVHGFGRQATLVDGGSNRIHRQAWLVVGTGGVALR